MNGNRTILLAVICLLTATLTLQAQLERGIKAVEALGGKGSIPAYHGLVIGINDYQFWPDLRQARGDAEKAARVLKDRYAFKSIVTLYDRQASRQGIIAQLREMTKKLGANDALLIYYSGHGYYDKLLDNGYWIPSEGRESVDGEPATTEWIQDIALKDILSKMEARHVLVVSDACFSGALLRGGRPDIESKENTWYRKAIAQPSRWVITSGDLEPVPDESVFASKFVEVLRYPRKSIFAASDIAGWLRETVAAETGRQPLFGPMRTKAGNEIGEFVFVVADEESVSPTPVAPATAGPADGSGTLLIQAPRDGMVSVNNSKPAAIYKTEPYRLRNLAPGIYVVKVESGAAMWQGYVEVRAGQEAQVSAMFPGGADTPAPAPAPRPAPATATAPTEAPRTAKPVFSFGLTPKTATPRTEAPVQVASLQPTPPPKVSPVQEPPKPPTPAPARLPAVSGASPREGQDWKVPALGMEFVWIAELGLWAGRYEVTNDEFRKFRPEHLSGELMGLSLDDGRQPVVRVSALDADAFASWITDHERQAGRVPEGWAYRLPDAREWLVLAQCGERRVYPWGDRWPPTTGNYPDTALKSQIKSLQFISGYDDGVAGTAAVDQSGANAWNLHGLGGNAAEWTREVMKGNQRAVRGGGWRTYSGQRLLSSEYRDAKPVGTTEPDVGFRLVLAPADD